MASAAANVASRDARLVNFSWLYAAQNRDLVLAIEAGLTDKALGYSARVANVVVLAAFVTEATINEVAYWLETLVGQPRIALPHAFHRFDVRRKWCDLPGICGALGFDTAANPWVDFNALVDLRNSLVHPRA